MLKEINVVWFKRDLRLKDHIPLVQAIDSKLPVVLIAFIEPSLSRSKTSDMRHWRFVRQSIQDLNQQLSPLNHKIHLLHEEVLPVFSSLLTKFRIRRVFSHEETGIGLTYERDKEMKAFFSTHKVLWKETPTNGVIRGIRKRNNWPKHWYSTMTAAQKHPELSQLLTLKPEELPPIFHQDLPDEFRKSARNFQEGGPSLANQYLESFMTERFKNYNQHISKPALSRRSCSRLSPYLAWGNLSMRQVYQTAQRAKNTGGPNKNLNSFLSRLRWHCHFIQKFEMMERYEKENINPGYNELRTIWKEEKYLAWEEGKTGYPLVDACIRCVKATGYLNFRMRSMLVSFLTHHLWLDWKRGADFLARQFLDFEPGIHYPQFQMQAGTTGYNTVRIYNPVKQSKDNDPEGIFIRPWVAELHDLPLPFLHEPWKMTEMDQLQYQFKLGEDYPLPIVDIKETYKSASKALWAQKKNPIVKKHAIKILAKQNEEERVNS